jgi:3-deoxy-D-manno-octulosonic acid kinase
VPPGPEIRTGPRKETMTKIERIDCGDYSVYHTGGTAPQGLVEQLRKTPESRKAGRGSIRLFTSGDLRLVCRKYLHGGLFRALTKDAFITAGRGLEEMEVLLHLEEDGIPVVHPHAVICAKHSLFKRLYLITGEAEGGVELIDFLKTRPGRPRLRAVRDFARLLARLSSAGVYHPDLHLRNVLVLPDGSLVLLDFDRARRQTVTPKDAEKMLWRLKRFVDKMQEKKVLATDKKEEVLFLRVFSRLSGYDMVDRMAKKFRRKKALFRAGWRIEKLLYGEGK